MNVCIEYVHLLAIFSMLQVIIILTTGWYPILIHLRYTVHHTWNRARCIYSRCSLVSLASCWYVKSQYLSIRSIVVSSFPTSLLCLIKLETTYQIVKCSTAADQDIKNNHRSICVIYNQKRFSKKRKCIIYSMCQNYL